MTALFVLITNSLCSMDMKHSEELALDERFSPKSFANINVCNSLSREKYSLRTRQSETFYFQELICG